MKTAAYKITLVFLLFALNAAMVMSQTISKHLAAGRYTIHETEQGAFRITMEDFGSLTEPGVPALPTKTVYIPLPPHATLIDVALSPEKPKTVRSRITIGAAPPLLSTGISESQSGIFESFSRRKKSIYSTDTPFPEQALLNYGVTFEGNRPIVEVRFTPFSWNPVSGVLQLTETANITVTYTIENGMNTASPSPQTGSAHGVGPEAASSSGSPTMLILSSSTLRESMQPLILWKKWNQVQVEFVSVEEIYSAASGKDKSEQIYNYLKNRYFTDGAFDYLLLIGNSDIIPIRKLYPNPENHGYSGQIPSDIYYSDLTCNWDGDGDGYYGEYNDDTITWMPEINVGRIPWSDPDIVKQIVEKIIDFEKDNSGWKNKSLLVGAMSSFEKENNSSYYYRDTDGAALMEIMKNSIFSEMQTTTLYEKAGVSPSAFNCDYPLSNSTLQAAWRSNTPGCLTWWAHGNAKSAFRKYWRSDNGNNIPENTELMLETFLSSSDYSGDAKHQPVIFANACDNGWPEKVSLARGLIRNGSSGIVAASRVSYATIGWDDINDGGNASLTYYFWKEFVANTRSTGASLTQARLTYLSRHNATFYDLHNVYTYNYYGDPTTALKPSPPVLGGISGQVTEADGTPVPHVQITLNSSGTRCETDDNGRFLFSVAPAGSQQITVSENGAAVAEQACTVTAGQMNETTVTLSAAKTVTLSAGVTQLAGSIHENQTAIKQITVTNTGTVPTSFTFTVADGAANWLIPDTDAASLQPAQQVSVSLTVDASGLQAGSFSSMLRCDAEPVLDSPLEIPVHFTVIDTMPPASISDLQVIRQSGDTLTLQWTAPGDNGTRGQADHYEIWSCRDPASGTAGQTERKLLDIPRPSAAGEEETASLCPDPFAGPVHIIVKSFDETGQSSTSNSVEAEPGFTEQRCWSLNSSSVHATLPEQHITSSFLTLANTGNTDIQYRLGCANTQPDWLTMDASSHSLTPGHTDTLTLRFDSESLDSGRFTASLILHTGPDSALTIPVTLDIIDTIAPARVTDLQVEANTPDSLRLAWTAPGDNGMLGTAERYELWAGYIPSVSGLPEDAVKVMDITHVQAPGTKERIGLPGEERDQTLYLSLLTFDETGRVSRSNTASAEPVLQDVRSWTMNTQQIDASLSESSKESLPLIITNTGTVSMEYRYSVESGEAWLSLDQSLHSLAPATADTVMLRCSAETLNQGMYIGTISLHTDSISYIPVTIHVNDNIAPGTITDLQLLTRRQDSLIVSWTAPGDNGMDRQLQRYEIRSSARTMSDGYGEQGRLIISISDPLPPGSVEQCTIPLALLSGDIYVLINALDEAGNMASSNEICLATTDVGGGGLHPAMSLLQNYPNPFNCETTIEFSISEPGPVTLAIINGLGQTITTLVDGHMQPGTHTVTWNGTNTAGRIVPSGIYFYRIRTARGNKIMRMLLLK